MPNPLTGSAGEHYVLYRLLQLGAVAALAPAGAPNIDIVVTDQESKRLAAVQVKTRRPLGSDNGWHMRPKHEGIRAEKLFYCFVDLGDRGEDGPVVYVVPSAVVAEAVEGSHKQWLGEPGVNGRAHKDSKVRRFLPDYAKSQLKTDTEFRRAHAAGWLKQYREAWHLLGVADV